MESGDARACFLWCDGAMSQAHANISLAITRAGVRCANAPHNTRDCYLQPRVRDDQGEG